MLTSNLINHTRCHMCGMQAPCCEYRASRDIDYQSIPLQCIVFSGSQHAIDLILVSNEADLRVYSNDSSPTSTSIKLFKFFFSQGHF